MGLDPDLSAMLPEPPPPRPAHRETAIETALARFDSVGDLKLDMAEPRVDRPARWGARIRRPHVAALATVALVAAVGLPMWLEPGDPWSPAAQEVGGPATADISEPGAVQPSAPSATAADVAPAPAPEASSLPTVLADQGVDRPSSRAKTSPAADSASSSPTMGIAAPAPSASARINQAESAAQFAQAAPAPSSPPAAVAQMRSQSTRAAPEAVTAMAQASGEKIVVTGSRIAAPASRSAVGKQAGPGDWNACTLDDPNRSLNACKRLADPAAPGLAGRAAAYHADGLLLAWRGDYAGAIKAFDQAIQTAPQLSIAYLNRGLAHRRQGDSGRALADLNRSVRYAPNAARGYHHRSLLLRERGEVGPAEADRDRAVALDPRYKALAQ
ncbi:MAG TPA: tetratricopeptide repeat protein [Allosphingosinicella sp.]|jgi:hypothetical protein|uniref:tetratricopeptide repeat protein n=1 Tax=Allosphingosinicella sp. TaxID=2823234 RepID=UPI002F2AC2EC